MKKKFICIILALMMMLSLSIVAFASEGGGPIAPPVIVRPVSIPICLIGCPEDCQCEDYDQDKP